ncbi:MAG TPA: TM2 domain-containing protein [Ktedonobacterales bacterium]|nr:TM2 domain-containing protein [Ktedonobacterales bacterium]
MSYEQPPENNEQQQQEQPPQEPSFTPPPPPPPPMQPHPETPPAQFTPPPPPPLPAQPQYAPPPMPQYAPSPPQMQAQAGVPAQGYDWTVALILSILLGELGVDRFYTGSIGLGILKLITFGGCGIWWIVDIILIATGSYKDAQGRPLVRKL